MDRQLIPLLLDDKVNLDLDGGLDLRQWWEKVQEKLMRGGSSLHA
jgi:hypothetical protein